mmetsp:Transcript_113441/g.206767  ORF Transcript_113441/g.206767 Transcript_113441/m.206767 type:complete len:687 (+) Transcript_113441:54-2114(+)
MEQAKQNGMEAMFLSKIILVLGERPQNKMTIAELWTLMPEHVKPHINGLLGLQAWLAQYCSIFSTSEGCVSLKLAPPAPIPEAKVTQVAQPAMGFSGNQPACNANVYSAGDAREALAVHPEDVSQLSESVQTEDDLATRSALHLRGLPFEANVADIRAFLGPFAAHLASESAIVTLRNRSGRPSGLARVQLDSEDSVGKACAILHRRTMSVPDKKDGSNTRSRYIEVFPATEMRFKATSFKPNTAEETKPSGNTPLADAAGDVLPETIVQECCAYMEREGKTRALLSTLGGELSPSCRAFMKKNSRGLKHILLQHSNAFSLSGRKGQETVHYAPASVQQSQMLEDSAVIDLHLHSILQSPKPSQPEAKPPMMDQSYLMQSPKLNQTPKLMQSAPPMQSPNLLQSPQVMVDSLKGGFMDTPSNWGTPPPPPPAVGQDVKDKLLSMGAVEACPPVSYSFLNFPNFDANPGSEVLKGFMSLGCVMPPPDLTSTTSMRHGGGASLWLSGLPANTTEQDVFALLSANNVVEYVAETSSAVHLVTESGEKLSQMAIIEMLDHAGADIARQVLDGIFMESRKLKAVVRDDRSKFSDNAIDLKKHAEAKTPIASPQPESDFLRAMLSPVPWSKMQHLPQMQQMPHWLPPCNKDSTGGTFSWGDSDSVLAAPWGMLASSVNSHHSSNAESSAQSK